jgi:nucleotide-binding universal stress UspA family protein
VREGPVASTILREARNDALIVLGQSRGARPTGWLRESPTWQIVRHSVGPVSVIKLADRAASGPSSGRVVVFVGGTADPSAAVGYAFRSALRRRVGITVVHGLTSTEESGLGSRTIWPTDAVFRQLQAKLQMVQAVFPEVDVRMRLVAGPVRPALVAESVGAALVVLSSPSGRRIRCARHKSVARSVARMASGPVTIV